MGVCIKRYSRHLTIVLDDPARIIEALRTDAFIDCDFFILFFYSDYSLLWPRVIYTANRLE